jgi:hypothetical protein
VLVATLESTRPARYSPIDSGLANRLRKFRDHTSSKNAIVTPCITRVKKSQSSTAPSSVGTNATADAVMVSRYRVMNPQRTMSTATQTNNGSTRDRLPRIR